MGGDAAYVGEPVTDDIGMPLRAWSEGDQSALDRITPIVYRELHRRQAAICGASAPTTASRRWRW